MDRQPTTDEVLKMAVDAANGRPFSGPEERRPIWDKIEVEVENCPPGHFVDVPFEAP